MARAKRTDRAEARRRYRGSIGEPLGDDDGGIEAEDAPAVKSSTTAAPTTPPAARPSIVAAFRSSFRPINLRGDLRALPQILTHWSFFVPTMLSGLAVALIPIVGLNALTSAFFQYFSFTAPLGTAFIAGFFAPRASYLVGILTALASVGFQAIAYSVGPFGGLLDSFHDANGALLSQQDAKFLVLNQALFTGVPSGALFAAAAAWYKRFLNRASPSRNRPTGTSSRRPDGKTPKRNQQRPMLARRR